MVNDKLTNEDFKDLKGQFLNIELKKGMKLQGVLMKVFDIQILIQHLYIQGKRWLINIDDIRNFSSKEIDPSKIPEGFDVDPNYIKKKDGKTTNR